MNPLVPNDGRATGASAAPTSEAGGQQHKRRRLLIIGSVAGLVVIVVVSVIAALSVAGTSKGASTVRSALVGQVAPDLAGETVTGGHASLAAYRGRWVIVNFFASWCVPCQKETPDLVRFAAAHRGPHDPAILGVVYQDDAGSVRAFIHDHHVTWPLLAYRTINQANAYGVAGIPVTFIVRPDGRVAAKVLGGLRSAQIDTLLANAQADHGVPTSTTGGP